MPFPQAKDLGQPSREALWRSGTQISNHRRLLRARRERPRHRCAAEQRDKLTASIKKTRSHGTIAKRVGLAKRPRSAKGKRSMVGTPQPRQPLGFVLGLEENFASFHCIVRGIVLDANEQLVVFQPRRILQHCPKLR